MMRTEVSGNAIEISFSRSDALLLGISVGLVVLLVVIASWQLALVALGMSLLGAGAVDLVQQSDIRYLGH